MTRKLWTIAALTAFSLPVAAVQAQMGYGVAAGLSIPEGEFGKHANAGYHATGLLTFSAPLAPVGLRVEGSFSEYKYKNTGSTTVKARLVSATANAVFASPGIIGPYIIGGVGVYHASAVCSSCTTTSTKGGVNGGAGFKFGLSGRAVFVEARFHYIGGPSDPTNGGIKNSSTQFIPISFGLMF